MKLRISIIARTRASFVVIHTACKDSINKVKYRLCHEKNNRELKVHQVLMILERKVKPHESQLEPELRCHPATEIRVWQRRGKERQNEIKSQARRSTVWNGAPGISASLPRQSRNPALLPVTGQRGWRTVTSCATPRGPQPLAPPPLPWCCRRSTATGTRWFGGPPSRPHTSPR